MQRGSQRRGSSAHPNAGASMHRILIVRRLTRMPMAVAMLVLSALPFAFVAIPPLGDVPGHMGSFAAAAYAGDPAFGRLMGYRWHPVPNLGTDLLVFALQRPLGIVRATWLVTAAIPVLLAGGILLLARTLNRDGAAAIGWALIFVYSFPLNYGFLNYMLGLALVLIGLAGWIRLDAHPRWREAAAWVALPVAFLCHVVAGCLLALLIGTRELAEMRPWAHRPQTWPQTRPLSGLLRGLRPLLSVPVMLVLWRLDSRSIAGHTGYSVGAKFRQTVLLLRDQSMALDIGSLLLALAVFVVGWRRGARPHRAVRLGLAALTALFVLTPYRLAGSSYADGRLLPLIPMLLFATQDWRGVDPRLTRLVAASGLALLLLRTGVTTAGFTAYARRYEVELGALSAIAPYSRVLVLDMRDCTELAHWRTDRLDHLGEMAIVRRRSWTNSEWDVDGGHLLQVRYRPSPRFFDDPSQYVWPDSCHGGPRNPTMGQALAAAPFDGIDALWLINAPLPAGYRNGRLALRWRHGDSAVYAVTPAPIRR